ncbi:ankyrin repeat domain-containing protein 29-like [Dysidea avara]|uniref:ankyrin repeat domain-containing protein 29-like n=1 Tax=Dysidea avara TaxID=196820 RepID=UPI00331C5DC7
MADLPPTATSGVFSVYSRNNRELEGDINAQLRESCQEGEEYEVKRLLKEGADSYTCDEDGFNALHYATSAGHLICCRLILSNDNDINAQSNNGCTALYVAAQSGYTKTVNELISKGAQLDIPTRSTGHTALVVAAEFGYHYIVQALVGAGCNTAHTIRGGFTALHVAAQNGRVEVLYHLIKAGCDVNTENDGGWTPFMMAVWHGHYTAAETLLKMGNAVVDAENESGRTALCLAAVKHPQLVKLCVNNGANVNLQDAEYGWTPLHFAASTGQLDIIIFLNDHGADIHMQDKYGRLPYHLAAQQGYGAAVETFQMLCVNPLITDNQGFTALDYAKEKGQQEVVGYINSYLNGETVQKIKEQHQFKLDAQSEQS